MQRDDELVRDFNEAAARLGISPSELLQRGALAVLDAHRTARSHRRLIEAYQRLPQDPALVESTARLAAETAPAW